MLDSLFKVTHNARVYLDIATDHYWGLVFLVKTVTQVLALIYTRICPWNTKMIAHTTAQSTDYNINNLGLKIGYLALYVLFQCANKDLN